MAKPLTWRTPALDRRDGLLPRAHFLWRKLRPLFQVAILTSLVKTEARGLNSGKVATVADSEAAVNDMLARMDDIGPTIEALRELLNRIHGLELRVVDRDAQWEDLVAIEARLEDLPARLGSLESRVNDRDTQLGSLARSVIAALGPVTTQAHRQES
ncbi:hypothetical protein B0T26DRAFT_876348 [Lasiosphaeria miniovina]|uniref:Uncharacterized protein n=1 Tax=Lasiosphaeria miniovina TaxID=1954250 RepID=A0AA39ZTC8_9PEZI|nr:uncharacterized protein B0T26DRAFT_876348 [Lasiosphaeria miniovina]KAK0703322.1 hypothetical protein B0T26DRAFT_876348 [Lasiosphaeria miniovina]